MMEELFDPEHTEAQKELEKLLAKYKTIFCDGIGLDVLADILVMCHFGASLDPDNKAQIAEYNVGVSILAKCGALKRDNLAKVIQSMLG